MPVFKLYEHGMWQGNLKVILIRGNPRVFHDLHRYVALNAYHMDACTMDREE